MLRTDLAVESVADLHSQEGIRKNEDKRFGMDVTKIEITERTTAEKLGKPMGNYVTLSRKGLFDYSQDFSDRVQALAEEIRAFLPEGEVLVAGLGNREITPDALGPLVADNVLSTRHFRTASAETFGLEGLRGVSVVATGVLGQTGIESAELIHSVVQRINPSAVIVVDALAARELSRLTSTVQLCDTGIAPGAGVQNSRTAITKELLGVPVIAIGVPTVVDAVTMAESVFGIDNAQKERINPDGYTMMVTTRDIDTVIKRASSLIALAINLALHPELSYDDILFLNS